MMPRVSAQCHAGHYKVKVYRFNSCYWC